MYSEEFDAFLDTFENIAVRLDEYVMNVTETKARLEALLPSGATSDEVRSKLNTIMALLDKVEQHLATARKELEHDNGMG